MNKLLQFGYSAFLLTQIILNSRGHIFLQTIKFHSIWITNGKILWRMQKLADYIGLPCRIARGCKYCVADHRSSCLVKIEDDRQLSRFDNFSITWP